MKAPPPPPPPPDVFADDPCYPPDIEALVPKAYRVAVGVFFGHLADGFRNGEALRAAGLDWRAVSRLLCHPELDQHYRAVVAARDKLLSMRVTDTLEERAFEGVPKAITHQGMVTGEVREYHHETLMELARAVNPRRYTPRLRQEHTGADGGAIVTRTYVDGPADQTVDEWEKSVRTCAKTDKPDTGGKKRGP